ncbi:mitogen-activated protein kinase kinase kinase 17-like [Papaver somniferum]|uniref:mitogen-activated protein kinase kinase kinase 17-like n=1 Tax=Papaver somniferum TaxID=3469 RepID=UPI000E705678|nr:mitogen-activated protein kinase kinase kinase 17-like [Papaver somniferum]
MGSKTQQQRQYSLNWVRGKCIGKGSFGTVNLAVNRSNGYTFAVKSVDMNSCHPTHIQSLENEIQILQSLSSPYIVKYLSNDTEIQSSGSVNRNLHMEYMCNGTVSELSEQIYSGNEQMLRSYTRCIVSALQYIHSAGYVHCDVKGKNVLVSSIPGVAKLADFGSAKKISSDRNLGGSIMARGTPLWMAPEVIQQVRQGPESDVWSLGCTVIEMITGKAPWKDSKPTMVYTIGYTNEIPEFPDDISDSCRDFLEKCLRRDPDSRWNCEQLLQHPFLSTDGVDSVNENSPRCVLDWANSEFGDDDIEENNSGSDQSSAISSAKDRISKLASVRRVFWESCDDWEVVRSGFVCDRTESEEDKTIGADSVLSNTISTTEEVKIRTIPEYSRKVEETERVKMEYSGCSVIPSGATCSVRYVSCPPPSCFWDCNAAGFGCQQQHTTWDKKKRWRWFLVVRRNRKQGYYCYHYHNEICCKFISSLLFLFLLALLLIHQLTLQFPKLPISSTNLIQQKKKKKYFIYQFLLLSHVIFWHNC